ncbi:hypothetical protein Z043_102173 [Scleropages formosus]|uniref:Fanconi anemia group B protein-like n=1 Tax=Scleropages formosus TaxID=113540 RepID=A0A0P7V7Z6_SCLFO|nr:hypothetical protein Z043_102173 [Scleropages formosus]
MHGADGRPCVSDSITPLTSAMVSREDRSVRLAAFNGDILSFQLTYGSPRENQTRGGSELTYRRMSFERDSRLFSVRSEGAALITKSSSSDVNLVCCAPALDVKSGQMVPCILLRKRHRKSTGFKYVFFILCSSDSLEPHLEFKLPYKITDNVTFLQGPTVLWSHEGTIFYTSLEVCEVRKLPIELSSIIFIGELPADCRKIIILGSQKSTKEALSGHLEVMWPHQSLGYLLEDEKLFDGEWILPHAYSSVAKCIFFISAKAVNSGFKSTVVAATSKKQLVWFESGIPKDVCQLPFEEPESIQMADTGRDGCLFIVSFKQGRFCSVWRNSFQVARCWEDVSSVFVDDFVGCGTDQLLLLSEEPRPPQCKLTNFTITDLGDTTYTSRLEESETLNAAETAQENFLLTVQALESRLQSGVTLIHDLQRELEVKDRVLHQSVQALVDAVSGREHHLSRTYQEGMVSLWDEEEEEEEEEREERSSKEMFLTPVTLPALVEKIWQRVFEDQFVVGVVLTPEAASMISTTLRVEASDLASVRTFKNTVRWQLEMWFKLESDDLTESLLTVACMLDPQFKHLQFILESKREAAQSHFNSLLQDEGELLVATESVSASLLIEDDQGPFPHVLQSYSRTFKSCHSPLLAHIPLHHQEPMVKRRRQERADGAESVDVQKMTVTVVTDLGPVLASARHRCAVLLHVVHKEEDASCWKPGGPVLTRCGHVTLDVKVLSQGKYLPQMLNSSTFTTEESSEDLLSLLTMFESWSFYLWSAEHTLCDVSQWLQGPMQCEKVAISPDYLLTKPTGSSGRMLFHWQEKSPFHGELHVHCRSQNDLLQFLDSLCRYLPSYCEVQPFRTSGKEDLVRVAASALGAEVAALREGVSALLSDAQEEACRSAPEPVESFDELQKARAKMEMEKERSRRLRSPLVGVDQYRRLTSAMAQVQLEGDVAVHSLLDTLSPLSFLP